MAEKEYIEREALLNEIEEIRPLNWTDTEAEITEQADFDWFENLVKSQPIADVVEVVRCKDCKKFCPNLSFCTGNCIGEYGYCQITQMNVSPDFYCGHGEKKNKE